MAEVKGTPPLRQGTIVQAFIDPARGIRKQRPAVVLTPTPLIETSQKIALIGVSTSYYPDNPNHVLIPWQPDGRGPTRLRRASAMCLDLIDTEIDKASVEPLWAYVPAAAMAELLDLIKGRGIRI